MADRQRQREYERRYRERHPDRCRASAARYRAKNREQVAASHLRRKYGLTAEERAQMEQDQKGQCKSCSRSGCRLVVDHCHTTGRIRGLLCDDCNQGIGHFRDSPDLLRRAAEYLEESHGE